MKLCGIEFDESLFKKRKGFRNIVIDGSMFQYRVGGTGIVYYDASGKKLMVHRNLWRQFPESSSYNGYAQYDDYGDMIWGKPQVAELYRKYLLTI